MATSKPSRRGGMKPRRKVRRAKDGKHYKMPGFDAFSPHVITSKKPGKGKRQQLVPCEEIVEPETGIHSYAWAASIVPQTKGFLGLPLEVRLKIYEQLIEDFSCGEDPIEPRKKGDKFYSRTWPRIAEETSKFYLLSRQLYVDFTGSGLLYRFKPFTFHSPGLLLNYLSVINPLHKNAIRSVTLDIFQRKYATTLHSQAFSCLSKCASLSDLKIRIFFPEALCRFSATFTRVGSNNKHVTLSLPGDGKTEKKIRDCESLRAVKGLKRFELVIESLPASKPVYMGNGVYGWTVVELSDELVAFTNEMKGLMEGAR